MEVPDATAWERVQREREPESGTPLHRGLSLLRREAELLYAVAGGRLAHDDLRDIRLSRAGGSAPVTYDRQEAIAYVDPHHGGVRRALEEADRRPDGIHVLVATIFGAVNRALAHVTDEHEAHAALALLERLADPHGTRAPATASGTLP